MISVDYDNGIDGAKCSLEQLLKMRILFFLLQYNFIIFLLFVVMYL